LENLEKAISEDEIHSRSYLFQNLTREKTSEVDMLSIDGCIGETGPSNQQHKLEKCSSFERHDCKSAAPI
jgi:hypothetical protein